MTKKRKLVVDYSQQSLKNAKEIVAYLKLKFSEKEVNNFFQTLNDFENIVSIFPTLYSESQKKKVRKAVLSKVLSVFYSIKRNKISIIAIFDNRWDEASKLK
jgi:hypothetical protein